MEDVYDDLIDDKTFNAALDHLMLFRLPTTIRQVKDEFKIEAKNAVSFEQMDSVGQVGMTTSIAAENRVVATEHSSTSPDNQTIKMAKLPAPYCSYKIHTV
ncbi:hypothetical protein G6F70_008583 [Rhizopus microsporus]|uniref:Uncharacterized protein n=1 Tax=Rhizopus microsporus TaxID=58291 RepID=A0A1X0RLC0_RHIZD|nr:hypothetical protein G6F71_008121 [Rhizopus microsporus]KAG1194984.1 hypothetical protein G6F70_008583 [Rhizopus microsporus]KAG1206807.1 hypothetical protein G6F69_008552 [Rhizopus microsporus]KAG1227385.1 hypothetical protein G6F67_008485 [Rhizopus microsporus]KAG1259115.1 hypothetical protein G6F68_008334 [Rhizopus microsporus]